MELIEIRYKEKQKELEDIFAYIYGDNFSDAPLTSEYMVLSLILSDVMSRVNFNVLSTSNLSRITGTTNTLFSALNVISESAHKRATTLNKLFADTAARNN